MLVDRSRQLEDLYLTGNNLIADKLSDTASKIRCALGLVGRLVGDDRSDERQGVNLNYETVFTLGLLIRTMSDARIQVIDRLDRLKKTDSDGGVVA